MGNKTGLIEVIKDAATVFKIQTNGGTMGKYQMDTCQIYKWICANNPNEK